MSLTIKNDLSTLNSLGRVVSKIDRRFSRLSSGKRINSASDDAAGLAVAEKLRAQLASLSQASKNADHGVSLAQVADGAMGSQGEILSRMRELAVQAANGTNGPSERAAIQQEFDLLRQETDRIAAVTTFNGQPVLSGNQFEIQVGTDGSSDSVIAISTPDSSAASLGLGSLDLQSAAGAGAALDQLDSAISLIASKRGEVGAASNRLQSAQTNLASAFENTAASHSRIADADYAEEISALSMLKTQARGGIQMLRESMAVKGLLINLKT